MTALLLSSIQNLLHVVNANFIRVTGFNPDIIFLTAFANLYSCFLILSIALTILSFAIRANVFLSCLPSSSLLFFPSPNNFALFFHIKNT